MRESEPSLGPRPIKLTPAQAAKLFDNPTEANRFPPVMSPREAAVLLGVPLQTLYLWHSKGYLKGCSRKRGKHVLILRDALIAELFGGPDWRATDEAS